jgi:hypothetical protein
LESNQRQGVIVCSVIVVSSLGNALRRRLRPTPRVARCSVAAIAQASLPAKWEERAVADLAEALAAGLSVLIMVTYQPVGTAVKGKDTPCRTP